MYEAQGPAFALWPLHCGLCMNLKIARQQFEDIMLRNAQIKQKTQKKQTLTLYARACVRAFAPSFVRRSTLMYFDLR